MKKLFVSIMIALASSASYAEALTLAKNNMCLACHAVDRKLVGPAYKDVAAKYAGRKDAIEYLTKKIKAGGSGVWGAIPMPAQPQLTDEQAKELAVWVLGAK